MIGGMMNRFVTFSLFFLHISFAHGFESQCMKIKSFNKFEIIEIGAQKEFTFCLPNKFAKHELVEILQTKARMQMQLSETNLSKSDIEELSTTGKVTINVDSNKLSKFELVDLAIARAKLTVSTSTTSLNKVELSDLARTGNLDLIIDSKKFNKFELVEIIQAGANVSFVSDEFFNKNDMSELLGFQKK